MMHVVQVSGYRDPAGRSAGELLKAWESLPEVALAAAGAGFRVSVVQAAARDERVSLGPVELHFVRERGWDQRLRRTLARAPRVAARVGELAPDLVHLHGLSFPLLARRLARLGAPMLVQDHSDRPLGRGRGLQRWGLARVNAFAFTEHAHADPFRAAGVLPAGARVLEVMESTPRFTPGNREAARREAGVSGSPCILWVGRLNRDKDPHTFLDALALALPRLPGARAWMAYTEAPLEAEVRARIDADPALSGRVRLLGRVPPRQVELLCRAADLFVACSRREGSGYALLEAMACGTVPVVTDIPGFRRITRAGATGALFPVGDAARLSDLLIGADWSEPARAGVEVHFATHLSREALGRELAVAYHTTAGIG